MYYSLMRTLPLLQALALLARIALAANAASSPSLPAQSPLPAPDYMVDNTRNQHGHAPDRGTQNGPVVAQNNVDSTFAGNMSSGPGPRVATAAAAASSYWYASMRHGSMPYAPAGYKVFRNVKDYGAKGDGSSDDTAAINQAITDGNRCGESCGSTSVLGAVVYFPPGTYMVSSPLVQYYYTQFVGDPTSKPTIKGTQSFAGIALIDTDVYIPGGNGAEWYINQNQFYRQIRNFVIDLTAMPNQNKQGDQSYVPTGIHWQVAQATSLQNIDFRMPQGGGTTAVGIFMENGSGGFVSDLTFFGGNIGMRAGSQQFTARSLSFTSCGTAISMVWDWGWTWKDINVFSCYVAIDTTAALGVDGQGTGSLAVVDSTFDGVPYGIIVNHQAQPAITLDNLVVKNSNVAVQYAGGDTILAGPGTVQSWGLGRRYTQPNDAGTFTTGAISPAPTKPSNLLSSGRYFTRSKPQYENLPASSFINVLDHGVSNDGQTDQSSAINNVLSSAGSSVVFFPAGIYKVASTITVPVGARIVGEAWSQIMGYGSNFARETQPQVMVRVGQSGQSGVVEISDILFTVQGATPGMVMVEWNVHEASQGSAGMWDTHFRVGGATGSSLQRGDCAKLTGYVNPGCKGPGLMMHVTSAASGYFENLWIWTADHDIDVPDQTQISVYTGRGLLAESKGPSWYYGTSVEHHALYQYQFLNASNVYIGHMQTETPYYQATPNPPSPFTPGTFSGDPLFGECSSANASGCYAAWAMRVINSRNIFVYGAGFYSFFNNYDQGCLASESCQQRLIDTAYTQGLWLYELYTKGATESVSPQGRVTPAYQRDNRNGFLTAISAWLELAVTGANLGGYTGPPRHNSPQNPGLVPIPCTQLAPSATLTITAQCTSGIAALPPASSHNTPPGPDGCIDNCNLFRRLTATCCGQGGRFPNPIAIPPLIPVPFPVPLPAGYVPNVPLILPNPAGDNPPVTTYPANKPLPAPVIIPGAWPPIPPPALGGPASGGPPLIIPPEPLGDGDSVPDIVAVWAVQDSFPNEDARPHDDTPPETTTAGSTTTTTTTTSSTPPSNPTGEPCQNYCTELIPMLSKYGDNICTDDPNAVSRGHTPDANQNADWTLLATNHGCNIVLAKSAAHRGFPDHVCATKSSIVDFINQNALGCNSGDQFDRRSAVQNEGNLAGFGQACLANDKNYQMCGEDDT